MPVSWDAEARVKENLRLIATGHRPAVIEIGSITAEQMEAINRFRRQVDLHEITSDVVLYLGRHHHRSRSGDGYSIDDMWLQIESCLSPRSVVTITRTMTTMQNEIGRHDGYGNLVHDRAVFELTQRRPRVELFSVIPKGDHIRPLTQKAHPRG